MTHDRAALLLATLGLVALAGCSPGGEPSEAVPRSGPNVLMIVIDTLRADHLRCQGHGLSTSPAIDALAERGVRFERAYATAPWTMPSVASMLTGLHPTSHGVTYFTQGLDASVPTLAEILHGKGYRTAAVISQFLIGERYGFDRGYDHFLESESQGHDHLSTPGVTRQASELLRELAGGEAPFFLLVHYFDPHENYKRHPEFGFAPAAAGRLKGDESMEDLRGRLEDLTDGEVGLLGKIYDEEIRFTDEGVGRLLDLLRELDLDGKTLVLLTADHGEELLDHGWLGHVKSLYEELVRVPLFLAGPDLPASLVVREPVSLVSIPPTVLDLLGIESAPRAFQADSLAPLLPGGRGAKEAPPVFFEVDAKKWRGGVEAFKKGLADSRYKLIRDDLTGKVELYDLQADPSERSNLAAERPDVVRRYVELLDRHRARVTSRRSSPKATELSPAELERLRGMGYVGDDG